MRTKILGLLGLARRGRRLEAGEEPVAAACHMGMARVVLVAFDAAPSSIRRAEKLAHLGGAPCVICPFDKAELGHALGRTSCAMAAVTDAGMAAGILSRLAELDAGYGNVAHMLGGEAELFRRREHERRIRERNARRRQSKPWAPPPPPQPPAPPRPKPPAPKPKRKPKPKPQPPAPPRPQAPKPPAPPRPRPPKAGGKKGHGRPVKSNRRWPF